MVLKPNSEIEIGSFRFKGVHQAYVKKSIHSYVQTAKIVVPAQCRIKKKDGSKSVNRVNANEQFKDGDKVSIKLGVNGKLKEEFRGFVVRRNPTRPLEVECEGYSYLMRRENNITKIWKKAKVSEIMKDAMGSIPITVKVDPNSDIELLNLQANGATAAAVLDLILKETYQTLNAFFIEPDVLWIGLTYVPEGEVLKDVLLKPQVKYRLGYNILDDNSLKSRVPSEYQVIIHTKKTKRERSTTSNDVAGKVQRLLTNHFGTDWVEKLKSVLVKKHTYQGFDGKMEGFIIPYCEPGYKAELSSGKFPENDGNYLIESTEVKFGVTTGFRRVMELGPKLN